MGRYANVGRYAWPDRFWAKVNRGGPIPEHAPHLGRCHVWTAATDGHGYGQIGYKGRLEPAHRIALVLAGIDIPSGFDVDHLCRTPICVRSDHLEPVTRQVNILRGNAPAAIANRTNVCQRGLHEYTPENTVIEPSSPGKRRCRACRDARMKAWQKSRTSTRKALQNVAR